MKIKVALPTLGRFQAWEKAATPTARSTWVRATQNKGREGNRVQELSKGETILNKESFKINKNSYQNE